MGKTKGIHIGYNPLLGEYEDMTKQFEDDAYQYEEWKNSQDYIDMVNQEFERFRPKFSEHEVMSATKYASEHITIEPSEVGKEVYDILLSEKIEEYLTLKFPKWTSKNI